MNKPLYKKWWAWVIAIFAILTIYGAITGVNQGKENIANKGDDVEAVNQTDEREGAPEESGKKIEVNEKLAFGELTVEIVELTIEDGIAILVFDWVNQSGEGSKYFYALASIGVSQGGHSNEELSGAYDVINKPNHPMQRRNPEGGRTRVTLEYESVDEETPIEVTVTPMNEYNEESQSITIDIN